MRVIIQVRNGREINIGKVSKIVESGTSPKTYAEKDFPSLIVNAESNYNFIGEDSAFIFGADVLSVEFKHD